MPPAWSGLKAAEGSAWSRSARRRAKGASVSAGYRVPLMCPPRDEGRPVCWGVLGAPPCAHPPVSGYLSPWPPERAPLPPSVRLAQGHHHLHTCLPPGTSCTVVSPPGHPGERAASRPSASRKPPHSSCRWRRQACPQVPCPHVPPPGPLWEPGRGGGTNPRATCRGGWATGRRAHPYVMSRGTSSRPCGHLCPPGAQGRDTLVPPRVLLPKIDGQCRKQPCRSPHFRDWSGTPASCLVGGIMRGGAGEDIRTSVGLRVPG